MSSVKDTIAAIATPPGKGGIGIIRLSGPDAKAIAQSLCAVELKPRQAHYVKFQESQREPIDSGLALFFAEPHSFTGEDVVELHGHGGPIVQDQLMACVIAAGARQARAGEFSERAYLNDKIDLTQAEAIADLIDSGTQQAARGAMRSLQGKFSEKIESLLKELVYLRMYVEAAIDFPDEEIDFLADDKIRSSIQSLQENVTKTIHQAGQGAILRNGLRLVIAGKPNAGKSSLLNALSGYEAAIVTDIPGTTRDIVNETIDIDGLPVHIIDTAGLRDSDDTVEKIGIARAHKAIESADHTLLILDAMDQQPPTRIESNHTKIINKIDLVSADEKERILDLKVSAKTGEGLDDLRAYIKSLAGLEQSTESLFTARRRHISALKKAESAIHLGLEQLRLHNAGELLADELLQAQNALNEITGEFTADDLLGEIFSGFCIGK